MLDAGRRRPFGLGRQHLAHCDAVDAHFGLHPQHVTDRCAGGQQPVLHNPFRLAGSRGPPRPCAVGAPAGQHDLEAMRHAVNATGVPGQGVTGAPPCDPVEIRRTVKGEIGELDYSG